MDDRRSRGPVAAIARADRLAEKVTPKFKSTGGARIGWINALAIFRIVFTLA